MQIHLPNHLKTFIEREVASGRYASEDDVIADALERLTEESQPTVTVAEAVAEALAQVDRGEGRELTDDVFDELLRESEVEAQRGVPVRDEAKYYADHCARGGCEVEVRTLGERNTARLRSEISRLRSK